MSDVNFLGVAQFLLQNVTGSTPAEETIGAAQVSQAAALIAIAERMDSARPPAILTAIQNLAQEALTIDGGHHKQWYLEKILALTMEPRTLNALKEIYDWEPGIAP